MSDPSSPIPAPRPDDDEDVHWALSTSSALWARGDTGEALKWLRRAAETASDQNRDQRSLELFKAAADATSQVESLRGPATPPPPQVVSRPPPAMTPSAPPVAPSRPPTATPSVPPVASRPPPPAATPSAPPVAPGAPPPSAAPGSAGIAPSGPPSSAARTQPLPPLGSGRPPMKTSQTPPPARASVSPARTPLPAPVAAARAVLKQTLPSSGVDGGREALGAAGTAAPRGAGPSVKPASAPTAARREGRRNTLDGRFQFPDDEVTVERDLAALRRPKPIVPAEASALEGVPSGTAQTSPQPDAGLAALAGPAPRDAEPAGAHEASRSALTPHPGSAAKGPLHATTTRTVLSAGMAPKPPAAAEVEASADNTPIDDHDLDELTSVLAGDEPELDFQGSATGESIGGASHDDDDDARTPHAARRDEPAAEPPPAAVEATPAPVRVSPTVPATGGVAPWSAMRVAVRRDSHGLRVDVLQGDERLPAGAAAAILLAPDGASAEALAKLLRG